MNALAPALLVMLIAGVAAVVLSPLSLLARRRPAHGAELDELEAEREAKYREIRDADLDHRLGKLSDPDHEEIDTTLRAEALEILNQIEALEADERAAEALAEAESPATEPDASASATDVRATTAGESSS
jgi:hypothetical protein